MTVSSSIRSDESPLRAPRTGNALPAPGALVSAVSWGAIAAGAVTAASLSLILLLLGVGLGLSSVSPWAQVGISAATFGVSTILWLTGTQLVSAGVGGYLAGRLRTRWTQVQGDEVYFRDTAHGFLAWAVATLVTAAALTSTIGSIVGSGVQAGASVAGGLANSAASAAGGGIPGTAITQGRDGGPMGYFIDSLFRQEAATGAAATESSTTSTDAGSSGRASDQETGEVQRIFMHVEGAEPLPPADVQHIGRMVARRTGLTQQAAEKRVAEVYEKAQSQVRAAEAAAREAADKARKASAYSALWLFVSLLFGAFVASLAATFGGRRRDA